MKDIRLERLAHVLTTHSLNIQKGQRVLIRGNEHTLPLIHECYAKVLARGGLPEVDVSLTGLQEILLSEGSSTQITDISPREACIPDTYDALLMVWGGTNTRELSHIPSEKIALRKRSRRDWMKRFSQRAAEKKLAWVGTQYPTALDAQEASMSLREYEDFVFSAGFLSHPDPVGIWEKRGRTQERLCRFLETKSTLRYVAPDTDISFSIAGRTWINSHGKRNFPDGEVFTAPHKYSVNGTIRYSFPAVYAGNIVEDVRLTFKKGAVVEARAARGESFLHEMIATDANASYVGEVALGTNENITRCTGNILFDEKMGGTVHLALGSAYAETGGSNESALHWDMICDMRTEGKIFADNQCIYEAGNFLIDL
ncbi:aminopeptidase [Chitinivibrio alkaliphilus]|uniref:Peptidase M29 aminopeptidase II n=1 Tax=Chitinivibrio alkaliphilus ACht1 TaxID=1313304 RepID=U7DA60_9BACT|nr:aminopeptidase [Chitinivibrio alkaliphilus]ERP38902.1 peptidase M29 aminopeptidase II [Chitinivibrio alkaliphilus ACht1]